MNAAGKVKNFVLDTNVVLHDPLAITKFGNSNVIIPIYVVEEVDNFKKQLNELGRAARLFSRTLDEYRQKGNLAQGVQMPTGGLLRVIPTERKYMPQDNIATSKNSPDTLIMSVALRVQSEEPNIPCIFITKDTNLRIRADGMGLQSENYEERSISIDSLYPGAEELRVDGSLIDELYQMREVTLQFDDASDKAQFAYKCRELEEGYKGDEELLLYANEYVRLIDRNEDNHTAMARILPQQNKLTSLVTTRPGFSGCWGIKPRNKEQHFALDCLLDDNIKLVTLLGKAGTGKTLIALAAGLQKATEEQAFSKLLVARPIFPLGKDVGFLPGGIEDKLNPWMQPIFDNVEFLMGLNEEDKRRGRRSYKELIDMGLLQIEALTYIRGRSIPNQYIIVDEAQNLTPHEVKTIITRVGQGTKVVLTGDPYQIDNPYVDAESNGLTYVINKFKGVDIAATVTLSKGERSKLAELASNLL
ncbi:MAG: PhoH family protein [Bradymonadales bacterium]|nr:PhoH family protein [Bradymonadales bacterium]